ncbi:7TM GPCR protein [Aphelenchoides avenae]|nr:7TM GPCR protein [Aphelenchus avenae]
MVASPDLLTLAEWSERGAAVPSYFLNLLLIWLILCWTPEKLRDYSRVLLCNCCADVFFTTLSIVVQPIISLDGSIVVIATTGPFSDSAVESRYVAVVAFVFGQYLITFAATVPFVSRYMQMCRNHTVRMRTLLSIFACFAAVSFATALNVYVTYEPFAHGTQLSEGSLRGSVPFCDFSNISFDEMLPFLLSSGMQNANYCVIAFCSWRLHKVFRESISFSRSMRAVNKEVTRVMFLQALSPLVLTVLPTVLTSALVISGISGIAVLQLTYPFLAWVPVLNPVFALCCVKAYRMVITGEGKRTAKAARVYDTNGSTSRATDSHRA